MRQNPVIQFIEAWPRVTAWIVLSVGCVALLIYEARDVGLSAGNWLALIIATVVVAGLCVWIVSWEDEEDANAADETSKNDQTGAV